jgi:hypothetical protein
MRQPLFASVFVGLLALAAGAAEAQEIRSPYRYIEPAQSLGVYAGFLAATAGEPPVGPQDGPIFGLRYNLRFTGPLSGEAALSLVPTDRQVIATDTAEIEPRPTGATAPMTLLIAEAGLRFHLTGPRTWRGLAPYLVATGGMATDLSGRSAADEELHETQRFRFGPSFAVGAGVGTDWFVSERLSLRLEARDHILRVRIPAGLLETRREETQWTNNFAFSLGTALHF